MCGESSGGRGSVNIRLLSRAPQLSARRDRGGSDEITNVSRKYFLPTTREPKGPKRTAESGSLPLLGNELLALIK